MTTSEFYVFYVKLHLGKKHKGSEGSKKGISRFVLLHSRIIYRFYVITADSLLLSLFHFTSHSVVIYS